jgi:hypothetical protein
LANELTLGSGGNIDKRFHHPHDTPLSSSLRFLSELVAWVAGPWAAAICSKWLVLPALILLIGLPSVFSTPNDKNKVVVATPGTIRVAIEFLLYAVAVIAPWFVWSRAVSGIALGIVVASVVVGVPRMTWLIKGANIENEAQ